MPTTTALVSGAHLRLDGVKSYPDRRVLTTSA